jgi:catechol 2,3-dioxygenase-like lactoylglutathione lyase family enzyme
MLKIRHIALASDHPGKAADFYKQAFGLNELRRFGIEEATGEARRPSGVFLTDGYLNIAILKFSNDQLGKGIDYTGMHHFGVIVDDVEAWTKKLEELGAEAMDAQYAVPPGAHAEFKFRGPDGVVFDITGAPWDGCADEKTLPKAAE